MKTKLGISVGLLGAAAYFAGLFGGLTAVLLVAGYALLFEENEWLKIAVIKAVALSVFFSVVIAVLNLVPEAVSLLGSFLNIFTLNFHIPLISSIFSFVIMLLSVCRTLLFLLCGYKALDQGTISFGPVDQLIAKHFNKD
ncbi:MAG: hypothetical protein LBR83_08840 [Clostridiales bacterium]|jgi:hypothetical protein|nr:hypothetical protein [Clostridiales bacterium]